jgi:predicted DCC family thiol-disulfide oxidoreductase YuxK
MSAPVLLFDGVCNLCNGTVQFVIARDRRARFRFASIQSSAGRALTSKYSHPALDGLETVALIDEQGRLFTHSSAILRVLLRLDGLWPLLAVGLLIPAPLRDGVYRWVSRHRYQWFGKKEECPIPTPEQRARFLG